ncbi:MAG TPA: alpha/beta hydrolase-fold protein [Polyangiaceae bacterium]|nr:alpha/beta hydrolase-fold protein [Polyangiaceae bacterium]
MARRRSRKATVSPQLRLLACFALAIAHALTAAQARADLVLVPSAAGHVGVFFVLGPLGPAPKTSAPSNWELRYGKSPSASTPGSWQLAVAGAGGLDLQKQLHAEQRGTRAFVGGVLELGEPLEGLLLVSADGSLRVTVDGQLRWSREGRGFRGQAWDTIPLDLPPGRHQVLLELEHPGIRWGFEMRWLDRADLRPPKNARWLLEGAPASLETFVGQKLLSASISTRVDERGFTPTVVLDHPRGMLATPNARALVKLRLGDGTLREHRLGSVAATEHGVHPLRAALPPLDETQLGTGTRELRVEVDVGPHHAPLDLAVSAPAVSLVRRALTAREALATDTRLTAPVRALLEATLEFHLRNVERASATGHAHLLNQASSELERLVTALGKDPMFLFSPGVHALAHRSGLDGGLQGFWLHVPLGFAATGGRKYPAVLALHGYDGSPQGVLEAFIDDKSRNARPGIDGFVIAPEAHGNAFYRGPGEYEAMAVLDLVRELYPVDPERTSVTGVSMGGTGSAELGLRYSDTFSAAAPLCGYHSYFIRRDTRDRPLRPWEVAQMHHWSTASWAGNGRHLPLHVAHGLKDHPLANSKVLIQAYNELGYSVSEEWPDIGHAVWTISYRGGKLWPWLSRHSRPSAPDHVTIVTDALRFGRRYWAEVRQFERYGVRARLDVKRSSPATFEVTTENVRHFRLAPAAGPGQPLVVVVDRERLDVAAGSPLDFSRTDRWRVGASPTTAREKRAGVEGPIRDVFLGPLVFVYGSEKPSTLRANREVAERFGRFYQGMTLDYPVVADRAFAPEMAKTHSLVLVGTADDHTLLRQFRGQLPIEAVSGAIRAGGRSYSGDNVGAIFIHPNPKHPDRYVVVITAPSVGGMLRALALPQLLPDFVVYDINLRDAATQQVLGGSARVRAAGFFERDWAWPKGVVDEVAGAPLLAR